MPDAIPPDDILRRLDELARKQNLLAAEIADLRRRIVPEPRLLRPDAPSGTPPPPRPRTRWKLPKDVEKFVGENLISKIGILILVIGVGIGVNYAIDNALLSPLTRILLGYLTGAVLLGLALRLKTNYLTFSAVLLSGAVAMLYFITFAAYNFYNLVPQRVAFALMLGLTLFTVAAAWHYDKAIIAHLGLLGAYAVPILLSDGSGQVVVLFAYVALINLGILAVSVKKYWRSLFYQAFFLTWLIYGVWLQGRYTVEDDFWIGGLFALIYFLTFYGIFLIYKAIQSEQLSFRDVLSMLLNSFFFYGAGLYLLDSHPSGEQFWGLFTFAVAGVHFGVSLLVYARRMSDRSLFYLVSGLVLVFLTLAMPVQLDGFWVTLLWAGEAAALFAVGRMLGVAVYEKLSYVLMVLAAGSLIQDWGSSRNLTWDDFTPLLNVQFLNTLLFALIFGGMTFVWLRHPSQLKHRFFVLLAWLVPSLFVLSLYMSGRNEIETYWRLRYLASSIEQTDLFQIFYNTDFMSFSIIWQQIYTLLFLSAWVWRKEKLLLQIQFWVFFPLLLWVWVVGTSELYALQASYLRPDDGSPYSIGLWHVGIRYLWIVSLGVLVGSWWYIRREVLGERWRIWADSFLYVSGLVVLSSELLLWLDVAGVRESDKLGLSILWGSYALFVIGLGIWKDTKHLRVGGIAFFGITLVKLFFYDLSRLDTLAKTIVFVVLGSLLLVISFLYNKYKNKIDA
ncbi:MAG: DUF2339 domain-containing protein [Bernardetiaceae bacterium]